MVRGCVASVAGVTGCVLAGSPALGQLPQSVAGYEVLARGVFDGPGFMLPPLSQMTNVTPRINNNGDVTFSYFDANIDKVIWVNGQSVTAPFFSTSDPNLNDAGTVVWRVSTLDPDPLNWGVWTHELSSGVTSRLTTNPLGASGWGTPTINEAGDIATRAGFALNDALGIYSGTSFTPVAVDDSLPFTFLGSTLGWNDSRLIAARANRAGAADGIFVFDETGAFTDAVLDGDASPSGDTFTGFLNGVDINDSGRVAVNTFTSGGYEIVGVDSSFSAGTTITVYADEDDGVVSDIALFNPRINSDGWIVFRAFNAAGEQAVFVGDGEDLLEIAAVGTQVDTDAGLGTITGFSGGVDINDEGQALVNAALEGRSGSLGRAIIRVDLVDQCRADTNGDGLVTPQDFGAWVQAFNAGAPACDQNGDGLCTPQDFGSWVQNFNAGC
ncbi:MAG: GC-type dockerin domain-anchored protein [Planctomycetota bacterium]